MSDQVTVTLDVEDWEILIHASRAAAVEIAGRALRSNDPEVHYRLELAARNYHALADRMSALTPEVTA